MKAADLRRFGARIERLKDEQDALAGDIREVYGEVAGAGYDKTALGQAIAHRRKRAKNPQAHAERCGLVEFYLAELDGASPARTREAA